MRVQKVTGLLFQPDMVRGLWNDEKDMTRRGIKIQPEFNERMGFVWKGGAYGLGMDGGGPYGPSTNRNFAHDCCPYGRPGDLCYVRENTWAPPPITGKLLREGADTWPDRYYEADGRRFPGCSADLLTEGVSADAGEGRYIRDWCLDHNWELKPSIHMPRAVSRMTLLLRDVRDKLTELEKEAEGLPD